jgi:hypothetical protein
MESIKPSKEGYGLLIYVVLAATAAIRPWIRGGVAVYPHLIPWNPYLRHREPQMRAVAS